jgi:glycosyltransferase involved in cell wall biosynthesis
MLCNLIDQIREQSPDTPIIVVDDSSTDKMYEFLRIDANIHYRKTRKNNGKKEYWKTVRLGLRTSIDIDWDWLIMLADDIRLHDGFFKDLEKQVKYKNRIYNFAPAMDSCWGSDQYVDGGFMAHRKFWERMKFRVPRIDPRRWERNPELSSGVWWAVTKQIRRLGFTVTFPEKILLTHLGNDDSKMNPVERKKKPLHFTLCRGKK